MRRASIAFLFATGCTGLSLGENEPGGDTWVEPPFTEPGDHRMGAVAVEPDGDQLWVVHEENRDGQVRAHLSAIDPVTGATHEVVDVTGTSDRRVVFPSDDRMILMAQHGSQDELLLIDTNQRTVIADTVKPTWYWGTRTSPSGEKLAVADNASAFAALHVIDTSTLAHQVIPHGGDSIEAMWNHNSDVLFALSVSEPFEPTATATVLRFDLNNANSAMPAPTRMWQLPGYGWDLLFSFTWITISPDDHWAVFPLIDRRQDQSTYGQHVLLVLDQTTGETALVPGLGPAGFTHDSHWIVSYGERDDGGQDLWLIDPATHATKVVTMPFTSGITFHPSRDSDYIVVAGMETVVYDMAADTVQALPVAFNLWDFVTRPGHAEIWVNAIGSLYAVDLANAAVTPVASPPGSLNTSINVRPSADQAVVGNGTSSKITRYDMATRLRVGAEIPLPSPIDTPAPITIEPQTLQPLMSRFAQSAFDPAFDPERDPTLRALR